ncbi:hypothetical protein PWYN_10945 [Paenibacillus wynnii]|uniref:ABC-2 type transporter transmembrane domain-containing protein n=2 Tax=Paenibacillus wynnii TaxID=268407 RepID=A0A098ME23_9BACL|nr:hypothetical protein PWYN_10945 [Paenibacillus wynnii]
MTQLMFWDWFFPLIMILAFSLFIKSQEFSQFILPGLVSLFFLQSIIFSLPYRLAQFNEQGILSLIRQKGSSVKLLSGFYLSRVVILTVQIVLVIVLGALSLGLTLQVNWGVLVLSFGLSMFVFLLLATFCGWIVKKQNAALGLSQAIYFLLIGTSGVFYPIDKSSGLLQILSRFSPLYYINNLWTEALFKQGARLSGDLGALGIFLILFLLGVAWLIKGKKKKGVRKYAGVAQVGE